MLRVSTSQTYSSRNGLTSFTSLLCKIPDSSRMDTRVRQITDTEECQLQCPYEILCLPRVYDACMYGPVLLLQHIYTPS
jgi:hypothetical protein